jgi:undecaprenyl-diphosphatase
MAAWFALIIFGMIQGLTEFLPVSSSGHLTLFQYFSKDIDENLSLNIAVHVGTLLTILIFYRADLKEIFRGLVKKDKEAVSMVMMITVATLPTGMMGLFMKKKMGPLLTNPVLAASCLLITGFILILSKRLRTAQSFQTGFGINGFQAFAIGVVQGLAVLPGISRSGSTIVMGLALGMNPKNASRFSFLISVPAIAGAGLLEFLDLETNVDVSSLLVGGFVSFLTGLFAIALMVRLTLKGHLQFFSYYVFSLSLFFFVSYFMGWGEGVL